MATSSSPAMHKLMLHLRPCLQLIRASALFKSSLTIYRFNGIWRPPWRTLSTLIARVVHVLLINTALVIKTVSTFSLCACISSLSQLPGQLIHGDPLPTLEIVVKELMDGDLDLSRLVILQCLHWLLQDPLYYSTSTVLPGSTSASSFGPSLINSKKDKRQLQCQYCHRRGNVKKQRIDAFIHPLQHTPTATPMPDFAHGATCNEIHPLPPMHHFSWWCFRCNIFRGLA